MRNQTGSDRLRSRRCWLIGLAGLLWACAPPPPELPDPTGFDVEPLVEQRILEATEAVRAQPDSADAWGRLGEIYDIHRLGEQAILCYAHAGELDPANWRWPYFTGLTHRESNQQAALVAFERAAELQPDYAPIHFYLGNGYLLSEDLTRAEQQFNRALQIDPRSISAMIGLARVALGQGEAEHAREILEAAARAAPREAAVHHNLAGVYRVTGQNELAERETQLAAASPVSMQPGDQATLNDPVREEVILREGASTRWLLHNGRRMRAEGDPSEALRLLDQVLIADPDSIVALLESARVFFSQGDYPQAGQRVERALAIEPENAAAHAEMANVLTRSGKIDAAIVEFETAIELDPMLAEPRNNLAALLFEAGRQEEGLRRLGEAAELLPHAIDLQYNYAAALAMSNQLDRAAEILQTAIERRPDYIPALYLLGSIEAMRGRFEQAIGLFGAVLRRQPNHLDARMDTGRALWELGDYANAIGMFTETLRVAPDDRTAAAELAWSLSTCPDDKLRNGTQALAIAQEMSQQVEHRDPRILDILAAAQAETGDFPAAANTTRRALQIVTRTLAARGATHPREAAAAQGFLGQVRERLALYEAGRPYRQP